MEADHNRLTLHACRRMQQRGIPRRVIEYVLAYGRVSHDHHGGRVVWLDKRARARLRHEEGRAVFSTLDKHLNAYVVMNMDGVVMTVGHRYRRIMSGTKRQSVGKPSRRFVLLRRQLQRSRRDLMQWEPGDYQPVILQDEIGLLPEFLVLFLPRCSR